jgi:excisionase family DNA binding protein
MKRRIERSRYLSIRQVRDLYLPGLSRTGIYRLIDHGDLPSIRIGKKRLIAEAEVEAFLDDLIRSA